MQKELQNTVKLQQIASNPQNSAWVFASAGSGKTKILVDRVLRLLLSGVAPSKILCLTFTKIAAIEMQERVSRVLASWAILDDNALENAIFKLIDEKVAKKDLQKARILFAKTLDEDSQIKIQTIHAFCQNLVKIFPFEMGVKPNFEVIDDNIEKLLLQSAKKEIFKEAKNDKILQENIAQISALLSEESFFELTTKILNQKEQLIFLKIQFFNIENVIEEIFKIFALKKDDSEEKIIANFVKKLDLLAIYQLKVKLEDSSLKTNQKTASLLKLFLENNDLSALKEVFFTQSNDLRKLGSIITKEFADESQFIEKLQKSVADFFDLINSYKNASATAILLRFIDRILQKYQELKTQNSYLDYNDLIIETDKLLKNSDYSDWVRLRMDEFFDHILVDESQDTNYRQWNIIKALTEDFFTGQSARNQNRTIFIIGDDKQSIYSFQGSTPNISHEIFEFYRNKTADSSYQLCKIDLQNSFRSLPNILKGVDLVFKNLESFTRLDYQEHKAIRDGKGSVEIWPQIKSKKEKTKKNFEWKNQLFDENFGDDEHCQKELLAEIMAFKIKSWIDSRRALEGFNRSIKYNDIMVLLRNRTNGFDKILQKHLQEKLIPFKGAKRIKFSDEIVIRDLLACAKFVLLPYDDLNLACLLKSPIFGLSEDELFEICVIKNQNKISLYEALSVDNKALAQVTGKLEELIEKSRELSCFDFFVFLINFELKQKFVKEIGRGALQIIDKFMIQLSNFCTNNLSNLQKFIDFCEKLNPEISISDDDENSVTITTVHSAKGLQAPIVIIPDCCFSFGKMPLNKENLFWIESFGLENSAQLPIWSIRKSEMSELVKINKEHKIQSLKEEYQRLLYVAMTRAENELYLAGVGDNCDVQSWYEIVKNSILQSAKIIDFVEFFGEKHQYFNKKLENFEINDKIMRI